MNRPSPGSVPAWNIVPRAITILAAGGLWAWAASLSAADGSVGQSGVVQPNVTTVAPIVQPAAPMFDEWALPTAYATPFGVAVDGKDRVWFTEMSGNSLAVLDPAANTLKEYRIPSTKDLGEVDWKYDDKARTTPDKTITNYSVGNPGAVIAAPDGMIWFVAQLGNSVVRFDPEKEAFTEYLMPTPNAQPYDLAADSKGRIWFVQKNNGTLAYLDLTRGKIVEIKVSATASLMGIAIDGEDNIWIGDVEGNYVGRYDPATKRFRAFPLSSPGSQPGQMRFGEAGTLWICNLRAQQLGVLLTEKGVYSVVNLPGFNTVPQALAIGRDGLVWVVDSMTNLIGSFDPRSVKWRMMELPTAGAQPMGVAVDSRGDVWFTESGRHANKIGRLRAAALPAADMNHAGKPHGDMGGHQHEGMAAPAAAPAPVPQPPRISLAAGAAAAGAAMIAGFVWLRRRRR